MGINTPLTRIQRLHLPVLVTWGHVRVQPRAVAVPCPGPAVPCGPWEPAQLPQSITPEVLGSSNTEPDLAVAA